MAYERWGNLGPAGDPAMSVQDNPISPPPELGGYTKWGPLGPYGNPLGQLPIGVHLVAPAVPVMNLLRQQWFPQQSPIATAGLGQTDDPFAINLWTLGYAYSQLVGSGLGAFIGWYHGDKRSGGKLGSKWIWATAGFLLPVPTTIVAGFQGFGKRK